MDSSFRAKWRRLVDQSRQRLPAEDRPFPTPAQLDLLKAALLPADQAAPAWQRWKGRGLELQTVADDGSMRLFPLLCKNREAAGIGPEDLPLLKGVYRSTFASNAGRLHTALDASRLLTDAGIPVLFIKGAAMIAILGEGLGVRRIDDVDLLVPEVEAWRAINVLLAAGYQSDRPQTPPVGMVHAWGLRGPGGSGVDLHFWALKLAGDDRSMFATAEETTLLGQAVLVSSATECLMLTAANGFQFYGSPVRWIADVMLLLESAEIDWDLMLERSRRPGVTPALFAGLGFVARELGAPVPAYVLNELRRRPMSLRERGARWVAVTRPVQGAALLEGLDRHRALRLHDPVRSPNFLGYWAERNERRRGDVLLTAPRTALRSAALLMLRAGNAAANRWRLRSVGLRPHPRIVGK